MTTERQAIERLAQALRHPRYEVIPLDGTEEQVLEHIPKEAKLTVTASPQKGMEVTLRLAEQLATQSYHVAPHLSARLIEDSARVEEILAPCARSGAAVPPPPARKVSRRYVRR